MLSALALAGVVAGGLLLKWSAAAGDSRSIPVAVIADFVGVVAFAVGLVLFVVSLT